jgi:hypothetical protein
VTSARNPGKGHARGDREVDQRDDLEQVGEEDEEQQRHQVGQEPEALGADHLQDDLRAHEVDAVLHDVLQTPRPGHLDIMTGPPTTPPMRRDTAKGCGYP